MFLLGKTKAQQIINGLARLARRAVEQAPR